jgi:hypothetical protein
MADPDTAATAASAEAGGLKNRVSQTASGLVFGRYAGIDQARVSCNSIG